jgi:hypothetical protein
MKLQPFSLSLGWPFTKKELQVWWKNSAVEFKKLTLAFLIWRLVLFLLGAVADTFLKYAPQFPYWDVILGASNLPRWFYSWANFDGVHYITIAQKGYVGTGLIQAFFPFLPYVLMHPLVLLGGKEFPILLFGLVITNVAALLLMLSWYFWIKQSYSPKIAFFSSVAIFFFPTAVFWGALYTESLFFLLVIWTLWLTARQKWGWVTMLLLAATATRVVGIFLLPAVWLEILVLNTKLRQPWLTLKNFSLLLHQVALQWRALLFTSLGSFGLLLYMRFLWGEFHDPIYFAHVQSAFGAGRESSFMLYPQVVFRAFKILLTARPINWRYFTYVQEFLEGVLGFGVLLISFRWVRLSHWFFAMAAFLLPTFTGTFSSLPRYILVCFPLYLVVAKLAEKSRLAGMLLLITSFILFIINTVLFIQGYWVG